MESANRYAYLNAYLAISPAADVVVVDIKTETSTDITAVYIQIHQ